MCERKRALLIIGALVLAALTTTGVKAFAAPVSFTVRRSHLRVRIVRPRRIRMGKRYYFRAIVRNVGKKRLRKTVVRMRIKPRVKHKVIRRVGLLRRRRRKSVKWRVVFSRPRRYRITVVANAREPGGKKQVNGARTRIKVISMHSWLRRFHILLSRAITYSTQRFSFMFVQAANR